MTAPDAITYTPSEAPGDADSLLLAHWSRDLSSCPLPIDPFYIAKRLSISVEGTKLDDNFAGALVKPRGHDPVIFFNVADGRQRRRFTVGHELGHYLVRARAAGQAVGAADEWSYVDFRDSFSRTGKDPAERYANNFAANLLMPRSRIRKAAKSLSSVAEMASLFDVSLLSMEYRLKNLGITL